MKSLKNPSKFLVYCGDGKVDSSATDDEARQVDETTKMLGNDLSLIVSQFTQDTSDEERERIAEKKIKEEKKKLHKKKQIQKKRRKIIELSN